MKMRIMILFFIICLRGNLPFFLVFGAAYPEKEHFNNFDSSDLDYLASSMGEEELNDSDLSRLQRAWSKKGESFAKKDSQRESCVGEDKLEAIVVLMDILKSQKKWSDCKSALAEDNVFEYFFRKNKEKRICQLSFLGSGGYKDAFSLNCCKENKGKVSWSPLNKVLQVQCNKKINENRTDYLARESSRLRSMKEHYKIIKNETENYEKPFMFTALPREISRKNRASIIENVTKFISIDGNEEVITLNDCFLTNQKLYKETLETLFLNKKLNKKKAIATAMCGLRTLIAADVRHGDIKIKNILCDRNSNCYLHDNEELISGTAVRGPRHRTEKYRDSHRDEIKVQRLRTLHDDIYAFSKTIKNVEETGDFDLAIYEIFEKDVLSKIRILDEMWSKVDSSEQKYNDMKNEIVSMFDIMIEAYDKTACRK